MFAITVSEPGGPDSMRWTEVPDPVAGPGEVVLDVVASAVNRADLMQREGKYPPPPGASDIIGLECSGRIASLGEGVDGWAVGDEVCALLAGGGYAQKVAVPAAQLMPIPTGVDLVTAAGLPEVACTVWSNIVMAGRLSSGETFLVQGGSSGIGTHAIQVAKALGARVAATAGAPDRLERCRELGADIVIDYHDDIPAELKKATDGHGADVILDNMGAKGLAANIDALAPDGRLVIIGMQGGVKGELDIGALLRKRGSVTAMGLRGRPVLGPNGKGAVVAEVTANVWPMIADGRVKPIVHGSVPMERAAEAHTTLEGGGVVGKLLLTT
ncbi:NAD(P)H-quinone oxidoreductase [Pseudonocardia sp. KRD-184]|uniref:NAD(P)H-quinone oxidoreductase n=1 Tax=Pseudonocardia oceani TaxID=2792013 RepID=A0ABS6U9E8_9PSEU|nr:NAD(P)H-quinone oxidoreductase [Pseudonocardia oceani]MBW0091798.1 NAD(P)H-quinone oxidoreductase [Pseudonocardia oceani]MBW0098925.1 NAD(P)H-quinone oxidoreductase [Pseudonocardia oceani]MBW0109410.1 NAD(P)H-quinone oxidoreductase [Pseudonocardia oceani]MBW0123583.1 NAD(P)H-quinone oxidoreductase [Pseudonocardia oceani]MBW0128779.1 NAD(P)H-quinone oxidoreductase [Pseudonocardia oceani]